MTDADLTLRIEHESGQSSELVIPTPVAIDEEEVTLASIRIDRALDRVARAEASVFRADWLAVLDELARRDDEVFIEDADDEKIFGGRIDDWQTTGVITSVQIDSFERDMRDAEPPDTFDKADTDDAVIASDIISPAAANANLNIQEGTIESIAGPIDFTERHTNRATLLRELARTSGGDVEYEPDGTVNYLQERGADRSETLSPDSGALVSEPRIRRTVREAATNVRVVSQSDPDITAEEQLIATSANRRVWRVDRINSESQSRLDARATALINDYTAEDYVEVEATIDPLAITGGVHVGDTFPVEIPAQNLDQELRVLEAERRFDDDGELVDAILANRTETVSGRDGPLAV